MSLFHFMKSRLYAITAFVHLTIIELRERAIQALIALTTLLLPGVALAAGDVADIFDSGAKGATRMKTSGLEIAQFIGVILFIGSLLAFKKIGQNPQITLGRCLGGLAIGALLVVVPELMSRTQKQMGMSSVTVS